MLMMSIAVLKPNILTSPLPIIGKRRVFKPKSALARDATMSETFASYPGKLWMPAVIASPGVSAMPIPRAPPVRNIPEPIMSGELGKWNMEEGPTRSANRATRIRDGATSLRLSHSSGRRVVADIVKAAPTK